MLTLFLMLGSLLFLQLTVVQFERDKEEESSVVQGFEDCLCCRVHVLAEQGFQAVKHHTCVTVIQLKQMQTHTPKLGDKAEEICFRQY